MANSSVIGDITQSRDELYQSSLSARTFAPFTRQLFVEAGLKPGMRVLDVCSGVGDVAFLAREIVGPGGHVIGFDNQPETVAYANERASFQGLTNVEFIEATIENLPLGAQVDAVVGRIILMYRRDPVRDLRALVRWLRPGGLIVFQELDMLAGTTVPRAPVIEKARDWIFDAFDRVGIELQMGPKLYPVFEAAGLEGVQMRVDGFIGGRESIAPTLLSKVASMVMPQLEALGIASADEVDIDTLEERIRGELAETGGVMSTALLIGAWAKLPA